MKAKHLVAGLIVLWLLFIMVAPILAEEGAVKLKWGIIERLRDNYYNNITDYNQHKDDDNHWLRVRTSLWGQVSYRQQLTLFTQLTNEFYPYIKDSKKPDRDFTLDEIFFDNLYLKWVIGKTNPVTMILGRQNLMYGEGFVLMDGSPWDGSRSIYHDAVKISIKKGNTTVDLLGISNTKYELRLPVIRGEKLSNGELKGQAADQPMNDGLEQAIALYAVRKSEKLGQLDAYYFYKTENPSPVINISAPKDELKLNTLGARIAHPFSNKLTLTAEGAYQFGSQGDFNQSSYGGYGYLSYLVQKAKKGTVTGGCFALSGDDPDTKNNEGWNPLFSRWPKWSELYIYSFLAETIEGARRVAYWTNILSPYVSYSMTVHPKVSFTSTWLHQSAFYGRSLGNEMSGKTRGDEFQLWIYFKWTPKLSSHLLFDYYIPGNFYASPRSNGIFARAEIMYRM
jgi:hypothetical protein